MTRRSRSVGRSGPPTLLAALFATLLAAPVLADTLSERSAAFVVARWDSAAVTIDEVVYIYQGFAPPSETAGAFVYAPAADTLTQLGAVYPGSRQGASAATDGVNAWTFGGEVLTDYKKDIIKHDPSGQGSFTTLTAELPSGRSWSAAAWHGSYAYVFGGQEADGGILDEVVRFDPAVPAASVVGHLPVGLMGASALTVGNAIYVFGGVRDGTGAYSDDVLRFDPASNTVTVRAARLPSGRDGMAAATDGQMAYLFGGCESTACGLRDVVRYDPAADHVKVMDAELPTGRGRMSAAWVGDYAYLFGGQQGANTALGEVLRYTPDPPNGLPVAHFELSVSGLQVNANAATSSDPEDDLVSYAWDWGDGSTGTGLAPSHTYSTPGSKTVHLTVTDGEGAEATAAATFTLSSSTSGASGGPVVIWYPSSTSAPASNKPSDPKSGSSNSGATSSTPSVSRVDPLARTDSTPGVDVVLVLGLFAAAAFLRRRAS